MTLDEFIENLKKTKKIINWKVCNEKIRGDYNRDIYCPITGVYTLLHTKYCPRFLPEIAGGAIGLDPDLINKIVTSADQSSNDNDCRKRLLEALELNIMDA